MIRDDDLLRHVRDLLRNLDDSELAASNPILKRHLRARCSERITRAQSLTAVRSMIDAAAATIPERLRSIIVRCDLAHEPCKAVAASLGICRRYFFRLRRQALISLGRALMQDTLPLRQAAVVEPLSIVITHAAALRRVGEFEHAIKVLERAALHTDNAESQHALACRLVDACCECHQLDRARQHLAIVKASASRLVGPADLRLLYGLESEIAQTKLDWSAGAITGLETGLHRVITELRQLHARSRSSRTAQALCSGLMTLTDVYVYNARFAEALATAMDGLAILSKSDFPSPDLEMQALIRSAHVRFFVRDRPLSSAIEDFSRAALFAERHGFARDAVCIAGNLCSLYLMKDEPERALEFGAAAQSGMADLCSPGEVAGICIDLCATYIRGGKTRKARQLLQRYVSSFDGPYQAVPQLIGADARLRDNQFELALSEANAAADSFRACGGRRSLGAALMISAEALEGLGELAAARSLIADAVQFLEPAGHPNALMRALRCSGRLTGNREHVHAAHDLAILLYG